MDASGRVYRVNVGTDDVGSDGGKEASPRAADEAMLLLRETTMHGLPRVLDKRSRRRRLIWLSLTVAVTFFLVFFLRSRLNEYFARPVLRMVIAQPLIEAGRETEFDVIATVKGSGLMGQAGAVRHGISRALVAYEPGLRKVLKPFGFMTRDPRVVERKKYGKAKARRSFQFSKR